MTEQKILMVIIVCVIIATSLLVYFLNRKNKRDKESWWRGGWGNRGWGWRGNYVLADGAIADHSTCMSNCNYDFVHCPNQKYDCQIERNNCYSTC